MNSRFKTLGPCAAAFSALAIVWTAGARDPDPAILPSSPNILFIFSDDHSLQTIGAYGARLSEFCRQQNVTPNIDRLAAEGGLFVNSFCGNSLCSPSRASVLTGLSIGSGIAFQQFPFTVKHPVREIGGVGEVFNQSGHQSGQVSHFNNFRLPSRLT